jgi:hypothetical protein
MLNARHFRDLAAMYREIAKRMNDPHAADSMTAVAARHHERADDLEQWSKSFARPPIDPET